MTNTMKTLKRAAFTESKNSSVVSFHCSNVLPFPLNFENVAPVILGYKVFSLDQKVAFATCYPKTLMQMKIQM